MKLIILLGQTSSGKTAMSLELAKILGSCWIVSCDSRQIYKKLDIGTGKIEGHWETHNNLTAYYVEGIPHFLIDLIEPEIQYSLATFIRDWSELFTPTPTHIPPEYVILVGGTGLWAKAIFEQYDLPILKTEYFEPASNLTQHIQSLSKDELQKWYLQLDLPPKNPSDWQNTRRLQNAVFHSLVRQHNWYEPIVYPQFQKTIYCAIHRDTLELEERITTRLHARIHAGLISEVESLLYLGDRLSQFGLEYRLTYLYLLGQLTHSEWQKKLFQENFQYARRQKIWLQKQPVMWVQHIEDILQELFHHSALT